MRSFIAAVSAVSRLLALVAGVLLVSAILSVTQMVFVRYVLVQSTVWQTEYTIYSIVAATFLGAPWVLIERGHVNVDLLQMLVGPRMRLVLQMLSGLASMVFVGLLAYAAWYHFEEAWVAGWTTETVWALPLWIPVLPMLVGMVWLVVQYIAELMRLWLDGPDTALGAQEALFSDTVKGA
ncbi:TRAP transporter small permease [Fulvimarina sp. 2208YS6-2-32]|uniref:TRAP transporter small permease protein n=1 Tax=Fulvimarina uroteuthidis TaxID=3098149 RepID=A0ABU5I1P1_9HYPH|nr:TRAP transporter small permease [Fulvimarina sp. 2208YS6-2-32]MDY8109288.1 TRAP transporter small permease [Fulvimarina sp. 2208YS6-2-32]